jgi:hypothetical protein
VRRRDRHGRGLRGPLAPPAVPISLTRGERFDDLVLDAVERLQEHLPELAGVEIVVEDVPPLSVLTPGEPVPLGRAEAASGGRAARLVVHRRTVELRAGGPDDLADLVHDVVAEQVAALVGLTPEQVDPDYGGDEE